MSGNSKRAVRNLLLAKAASTVLLWSVFLFLFRDLPIPGRTPDSETYIFFAKQIVSGALFEIRDPETLSVARAMRTPGFPVLLALIQSSPIDFELGVRCAFTALALVGIAAVSFVFDGFFLSCAGGSVLVYVLWSFRAFYSLILTEWPTLHFLVFLLLALVCYFRRPSTSRIVLVGVLCSFLALIRPAMIITLPIPFVLGLCGERKLRPFLWSAISMAPVLLWMTFNWFYIGTFGLAAFGGTNVFGVASIISSAEVRDGDSRNLRIFIRRFNARKLPPVGRESECRKSNPVEAYRCLFSPYPYNIWKASKTVARRAKLNPVEWNALMLEYATRALWESKSFYLSYIWWQLYVSFTYWSHDVVLVAIIGLGFVCAVGALVRRDSLPMGKAAAVMFAVHALHLLVVSMVEQMLTRYHFLTFYALFAACLWCMCERVAANPPGFLRRRKPSEAGA